MLIGALGCNFAWGIIDAVMFLISTEFEFAWLLIGYYGFHAVVQRNMAGSKRITKRTVDLLNEGEVAWDANVRGFGVRRQRTRKIYLLKARINGRQRWITIGDHGSPWTPETARKEAQRLWGEIHAGADLPSVVAVVGKLSAKT
jgi:hypothetical protein